jgi:D-beta-D-heptose 7-phosphate kinase/D-beta-D-heptose 1-phosphate adenosyltransferase
MKTIVLITGGFDPLHSGHISYFNRAKELGDILIVGINSDDWLARKKGKPFLPRNERSRIIQSLKMVDFVIDFKDEDGSAKHAIKMVRQSYPQDQIIFANGGDRTDKNIPEMDIQDDNLKFVFGVGGFDKQNSSSWILEEWKSPKTERPWGHYRVLHENGRETKLKELTVMPGKCLSMQKHQYRAEHWFVAEGTATVYTINQKTDAEIWGIFTKHQHVHIGSGHWHQLCNEGEQHLKIIEIQYGDRCVEEDIERR